MKIELLGIIITFAGLIFFSVSLVMILLGKKVGGSREQGPQKVVVGKWFEMSTNSMLTLCVLTAAIALAPLVLNYWKPDVQEYIPRPQVEKDYILRKDLVTTVSGNVVLDDKRYASDVQILVIRPHDGKADTIRSSTDQFGMFELSLLPESEYNQVVWRKEGYQDLILKLKLRELKIPLQLTKGGND